jgi:uncharacterized membrane protein
MSELVVLAFDREEGASEMMSEISALQRQELIKLDDAAVVVRKLNGRVKVKQAQSLVGTGAVGGAFWGMLIGLLFLAPWLGAAIGAMGGALGGKMTDVGIDDKFIKQVGGTIQPGNSALFMLVRASTTERVLKRLQDFPGTSVLRTSLSEEQEAKLRAAFAAEEPETANV